MICRAAAGAIERLPGSGWRSAPPLQPNPSVGQFTPGNHARAAGMDRLDFDESDRRARNFGLDELRDKEVFFLGLRRGSRPLAQQQLCGLKFSPFNPTSGAMTRGVHACSRVAATQTCRVRQEPALDKFRPPNDYWAWRRMP